MAGENNFINNLDNFRSCCRKVIALTFDSNLTLYENVCSVITKLNEVIDSQNMVIDQVNALTILFQELKEFVINYFDNLDVQEEINNKLDEMLKNGELDAIFNQYIIVSSINPHRIYTNLLYPDEEVYYNLQGFTRVGDNNAVYLLRNTTNHSLNQCKLVEISLSTGNTLREVQGLILNHGNALAYNADKNILYCAGNSKYDSDGNLISDNTLFEIDYNTFMISKTTDMSELYPDTRVRTVSYDNKNKNLMIGGTNIYYIINEDDYSNIKKIELDLTNTQGTHWQSSNSATFQTTKLYDNKMFALMQYPNAIAIFSTNGSLIRYLLLPKFIDEMFYIGEPEDLDIDTYGNIYFTSTVALGTNNIYTEISIHKTNYRTNLNGGSYRNQKARATNTNTIYISTNAGNYQNGTQEYPLKEIQQGINVMQGIQPHEGGQISVAEGEYKEISMQNYTVPISITAQSNANVKINNVICIRSNNVYINGCDVINWQQKTIDPGYLIYNTTISRLRLNNVMICSGVNGCDDDDITTSFDGIYNANESELFLNSSVIRNVNRGIVSINSRVYSLDTNFMNVNGVNYSLNNTMAYVSQEDRASVESGKITMNNISAFQNFTTIPLLTNQTWRAIENRNVNLASHFSHFIIKWYPTGQINYPVESIIGNSERNFMSFTVPISSENIIYTSYISLTRNGNSFSMNSIGYSETNTSTNVTTYHTSSAIDSNYPYINAIYGMK